MAGANGSGWRRSGKIPTRQVAQRAVQNGFVRPGNQQRKALAGWKIDMQRATGAASAREWSVCAGTREHAEQHVLQGAERAGLGSCDDVAAAGVFSLGDVGDEMAKRFRRPTQKPRYETSAAVVAQQVQVAIKERRFRPWHAATLLDMAETAQDFERACQTITTLVGLGQRPGGDL